MANNSMPRFLPTRRAALATSVAVLLAAAAPPKSSAADRVWDDGGSTFNWSQAANWAGDIVPVDGDKLIFGNHSVFGNGTETVNNDLGFIQPIGLLFNGSLAQGGYIINGDLFVIHGSGIDQASQASQTINASIVLGANQTWSGTAGSLIVTGLVIGNAGADLRVTGNFSTEISGNISGAGTSVEIDGTSALTLSGTNSYTGGTLITNGNIVVTNADSLGTGPVTMTNGGLISGDTFTLPISQLNLNAGSPLIGATAGETLTLDITDLNFAAGSNLVFGSAGSTGTVVFGDFGTTSTSPGASLRVAFGTLRAGSSLDFVTQTVASTTINAGATLDLDGQGGSIRNLQAAGTVLLGSNAASILDLEGGSVTGSISGLGTVRITDGTLELNNTTPVIDPALSVTNVIIGDNIGAVTTAVLILETNSQISNSTNITVNRDGLFHTNGYFERIGALTVNGGLVRLPGVGGGQALVVEGTLNMTGGNIIGVGPGVELTLLGDVIATSDAVNEAQINAPVNLAGARSFTVNDGPDALDLAIFGVVRDGTVVGSSLIKNGTGTLLLGGAANTYTGGTTINAGRLIVNDNGALGTGNVIFGGTSEFRMSGTPFTSGKTFTVQNDVTARFSNTEAFDATLNGTVVLQSGADLAFGAADATGVIVFDVTPGIINFGHTFSVDFGTVRNGAVNGITTFTSNSETTTIAAGATLDTFGFGTTILNLQGAGTLTNTSAGAANYTVRSGNFSGVITQGASTTGLIKSGAGTLTLSGASNFTGGTSINAGRLITQNASALGGAGGPVFLAGGALQPEGLLNTASVAWSDGQIALRLNTADLLNTGAFVDFNGATTNTYEFDLTNVDGLGTFIVTTFGLQAGFVDGNSFSAVSSDGNTTVQGFFTLNPNNVEFTLTGATVSGPVIQNSAPVNTPTFADFVVQGTVRTGGPAESNTVRSLTFTPGSSLDIFNTLTVTQGPVNLVGGSSIHFGNIATLNASQLNLQFGSLLHGNGTVTGDLYNNGLVSPGNSPGYIYAGKNYVQGSQGTLKIEIGGTDEEDFDRLIVNGHAELDGTLELVRLNKFKLERGDRIEFLSADGGVDGEFAHISNPFYSDTILEPTVVYGERSVALELVRGSFEKYAEHWGLTPNQHSVAEALDSVSADDPDNRALVYLDERHLTKLPGDFDKIAPEELTSLFTTSTSMAQVQGTNLQRRTDDIRSGANGFSAAGMAVNGRTPSYSGDIAFRTGAAGPSGDGKESKESKEVKTVVEDEKRWGAFVSGTGEWVDVSGDGNARGYDITTGGFTIGLDYKVTENFAIGLAAGYAGTTADLTDDGRVWVNGGKLGLYATYFTGGFYLDAAVSGGYNSYDTKRSALQGTARGSTDGGELNVLVGAGYDWKIGALTIGPTATFQYTLVGIDGFTERGSLAPLDIEGSDAESIRSTFGFKASCDWKVGGVLIKPELRAAWQHEYGDKSYDLSAGFASGAGDNFLVNGPELGRDSLLVGAGFAIMFSETVSTYVYYDGELLRDRYDRHSVTGGIRIAF